MKEDTVNPFKKNSDRTDRDPNPDRDREGRDTAPDDLNGQDGPAAHEPAAHGPGAGVVIAGEVIDRTDTTTPPDASTGPDTGPDAGPDPDRGAGAGSSGGSDSGPVSAGGVSRRERARRDVVPAWVRDPALARDAAQWGLTYTGHVCAFHTVRAPVYVARLVARAPRGAARGARGLGRWVIDADTRPVRAAMIASAAGAMAPATTTTANGSPMAAGNGRAPASSTGGFGVSQGSAFEELANAHRTRVRHRAAIAATGLAGTGVLSVSVLSALPGPGQFAATITALAVTGLAGRVRDRPVITAATDTVTVPRLTHDVIITALASLGIGQLNKAITADRTGAVAFTAPIVRDGQGWRADMDLPPGVTAADVAERRDRLASGLRRPVACVWPESNPDIHEGRFTLWVADAAMNKTGPKAWPLAAKGKVNFFDDFPLGTDPRGRPVTMTAIFASMVIGAVPRMGKSFTLRLILLAAALDPRVEIHIYDLKGGADMRDLSQVAHSFRIGDDDDDIIYLLTDLRQVKGDMRRRYKVIRGLPVDVCKEGKVTDGLASDPSLGLHPVVLALDECQYAFEHPEHGKEITALVEDLAKRGPAAGICVILATQRVDAKSIPTSISSNATLRFCLKVAGQTENDMVLGTSMYRAGYRATMFARSDRGTGYLVGEGDDPQIVRAAYIDAETAATIATRARATRLAAGRVTGHAAGIEPDTTTDDTDSILDHLMTVWPATVAREWSQTLATELTEQFPDTYPTLTADTLAGLLKPHGITTGQIKKTLNGRPANKRGIARSDLLKAVTVRDQRRAEHTEDNPDETPDQQAAA